MDASEQGALARMVQNHVPEQPWGHRGNAPVPIEIYFDAAGADPAQPWSVKFVTGLKGENRRWAWASGGTLTEALRGARHKQLAAAPPRVDPGGDPR
jgi:hypothetical protein